MPLIPNWLKQMFGYGARNDAPRPRPVRADRQHGRSTEENEFYEKWGFVPHRFEIQRRCAAEIEKAGQDLSTPHLLDPTYSRHNLRNISPAALRDQMVERIATAGYAPLRRPILNGDDFDGLFVLADGLAYLNDAGKLSTIEARNQSYETRDDRINHLGTYTVTEDGIFALIDVKGRMFVSSISLISSAYTTDSFRELLLRSGMIETQAWKPRLSAKSVIVALTSGLDDQIPFKAEYETHVKYHTALALPVLSEQDFANRTATFPIVGQLPPPPRNSNI